MAAAARAASRSLRKLVSIPAGKKALHTGGCKQMGHDSHGSHGGHDYMHAENMYNLTAMKNRRLKFGLAVSGVVVFGTAVPLIAVVHQQRKVQSV